MKHKCKTCKIEFDDLREYQQYCPLCCAKGDYRDDDLQAEKEKKNHFSNKSMIQKDLLLN